MLLKFARNASGLWLGLLISALLLGLSTYFASSQQITGYELTAFRFINNWPDTLEWLFLGITQFGSVWMLFAVTLLSLWKHRYRLAVRVFTVGTTAFFITEGLKRLIARPRPAGLLINVNLRESLSLGYGFPSGHTAVAAAVSIILIPFLPAKWRWLPVAWIGLVGLSRVYLGVHAPVDIVGGIAVGVSVVCLAKLVRNKLRFVTKITRLKLSD